VPSANDGHAAGTAFEQAAAESTLGRFVRHDRASSAVMIVRPWTFRATRRPLLISS
jgi:hypothetical protein